MKSSTADPALNANYEPSFKPETDQEDLYEVQDIGSSDNVHEESDTINQNYEPSFRPELVESENELYRKVDINSDLNAKYIRATSSITMPYQTTPDQLENDNYDDQAMHDQVTEDILYEDTIT